MTDTAQNETQDGKNNLPTHVAKTRIGYGKKATYEQVGVAWQNDDGSFYIKLYGTQVISSFSLYSIQAKEQEAA
ncbi:hypothetical protein [Terasakiella sp.]|uniref:hypothetical protein n=1 Tax=Terasakiella sp. TaxID=2034861 RepID=UPI003AA9A02D